MRSGLFIFAAWALLACAPALAAEAAPGAGFGGVVQMLLGLALVLGVFGAVAWLMKRTGAMAGGSSGVLKLVGGIAVGTRERVVLVEVGDNWIVVGIAPGSVTQLACLPRGERATTAPPAEGAAPSGFAGFLKHIMEKRNVR
jgi:flagellar protein FliO/FliZ